MAEMFSERCFFFQSCKTKPNRSAGMIKQTTGMVKSARFHGDTPDTRPLERWGGTYKAFKPQGQHRDPSLVTESHRSLNYCSVDGSFHGL